MKSDKSPKKLKYKLDEQIDLLPRTIAIADILKTLKEFNISRDSFYRDKQIELTSDYSIPSDRLDAYATIFGCTADDLKNYKVKGKSLIERFHKGKIKTGLKALLIALLITLQSCASYSHCPTYAKQLNKSITPKHTL